MIIFKSVYAEDIEVSQSAARTIKCLQWSLAFVVLLATNVFFLVTFFAQIQRASPLMYLGSVG